MLRGCPPGAAGRRGGAPAPHASTRSWYGQATGGPSPVSGPLALDCSPHGGRVLAVGPHRFKESPMSGFENHLRQQAAETRVELGLDRGEDVLAREQARIDARRRQEAEMHARTEELLAEGREMLRKLRGDDSGR